MSAATMVVFALLSLGLTPTAGWGQDCGQWLLVNDTGPSARYHHAMAYDSGRGVTVLFGGDDGSYLNDTWEWDGTDWLLVPSQLCPSERRSHAMAYDSARGVTVLFGGRDGGGGGVLGDTWEWDGATWTLVSEPGPSARIRHTMAYDTARGVTVLFGGWDGSYYGDTWEWDGAAWTLVSQEGPSQRDWHTMAYDSARGVTVLFGGRKDTQAYGDTWEWDGAHWTLVSETGPSARRVAAMAYDSARGVSVLYGGHDGTSRLGDTWEWDGARWTFASQTGPLERSQQVMAYDSGRGLNVLFGRNAPHHSGDTWEFICQAGFVSLRVEGTCPGQVRAIVSDATPAGSVSFIFGLRTGQTRIPSGACAGTVLPISTNVRVVATARADGNGNAAIVGTTLPSACGAWLVALDIETCTVSNVRKID